MAMYLEGIHPDTTSAGSAEFEHQQTRYCLLDHYAIVQSPDILRVHNFNKYPKTHECMSKRLQ